MMKEILVICIMALAGLTATAQDSSKVLKPTGTEVLIKVVFTDFNGEAKAQEMVFFEGFSQQFSGQTDAAGKLEILLPKGDTYKIKYFAGDKEVVYSALELKNERGLQTYTIEMQYQPRKVYSLENLKFEEESTDINEAAILELNSLADYMRLKESVRVEIASYTGSSGNSETDKSLTQARAETIKNYLVSRGISGERIEAKGYGSNDPAAGETTTTRTEVVILQE